MRCSRVAAFLAGVTGALAVASAASASAALPGAAASPAGAGGVTSRVSVASDGRQGNADSYRVAVSAGGRFVAFQSRASNLVAGDTNASFDVFVRDRLAGLTRRVSVGAAGQGNADSYEPAVSANGRFVAFESWASNLVPGDTNASFDVFVRDRLAGLTRRVSVGAAGQGNADSYGPAISADGRFVAFSSNASNLVPGDTNGAEDVFVRDRLAGVTRRVSVGAAGQANDRSFFAAISADGRFVAFNSLASNLVPGHTNASFDVFVRDRLAGVTRRVSVGAAGQGNGASFNPAISADGLSVAFDSDASNLVPEDTNGFIDVFVRDRLAGVTRRVSVGAAGQSNDDSGHPAVSADGRIVVFASSASNLVPEDTNGSFDVFVRDRLAGVTRRVSVGAAGQGNADSYEQAISADGRSVVFASRASNLVPGDTNCVTDVFARDPLLGPGVRGGPLTDRRPGSSR